MLTKFKAEIVFMFQVHLFTGLQLLCFVTLWLIQTFKQTSILFPIMLVLLIGIRKLLDFVFTPKELKVLDDMLPASKRTEILDLEQLIEEKVEGGEPGQEGAPIQHPFWNKGNFIYGFTFLINQYPCHAQ